MELLFFSCLGIINRGDSFRRKRSRSNSLATSPMSPNHSPSTPVPSRSSTGPVESYRVSMLGGPGVGKTALISQFCTSECINAYEDTGKNIRIYVCLCTACSLYANGFIRQSTGRICSMQNGCHFAIIRQPISLHAYFSSFLQKYVCLCLLLLLRLSDFSSVEKVYANK